MASMSHEKTDFNVGKSSPSFARETLVSLLTAMLRKDQMRRLMMRDVVYHAWFEENHPKNFLWNAEPEVINESVEEEPRTGSSLCHGEDVESTSSEDDESTSSEDDESTSIEEVEEFNVGQVVVGMWKVISKIGEGGFGFVYQATNVISAKEVALKLAKSVDDGPMMLHEAYILTKLHHENIVKLLDIPIRLPDSHRVALVLEYVKGGSLASQIHHLRKYSESSLRFHLKQPQWLLPVEYLHSRNIVHRDIKLENVLLSKEGTAKLIDFDLATPFIHGKKFYDCCGTYGYMAPEITAHGYEGPPVDVWALAILFKKLFIGLQFDGRHIIIEMSHDKTDLNVGKGLRYFPRRSSPSLELVSLLTPMLQKDPMERLTMTDVVKHTWFKRKHW
uniref:uncharacterized protein n=1 Tax=Myxine glutinosa TaxID=7769 RepID=UPI00358EE4C5